MSDDPKYDELVKLARAAAKALTDEGRIIEAGWTALRIVSVPVDASDVQVGDMRFAFFSGASHLLDTLMAVMDSDREPTANDLRRLALISAELKRWAASLPTG